jgi:hypothetical protein
MMGKNTITRIITMDDTIVKNLHRHLHPDDQRIWRCVRVLWTRTFRLGLFMNQAFTVHPVSDKDGWYASLLWRIAFFFRCTHDELAEHLPFTRIVNTAYETRGRLGKGVGGGVHRVARPILKTRSCFFRQISFLDSKHFLDHRPRPLAICQT